MNAENLDITRVYLEDLVAFYEFEAENAQNPSYRKFSADKAREIKGFIERNFK